MHRDGVRNLVKEHERQQEELLTSISAAKRRQGKCEPAAEWEKRACEKRTDRSQKYSMAPPPRPLLVRPVPRNPRSLRAVVKSRARKTYPGSQWIKSGIVWTNRTYITPRDLMGCTHKWWGSWLIWGPLSIISERSYLLGKVPGDWKKENVTSRRARKSQISQRALPQFLRRWWSKSS